MNYHLHKRDPKEFAALPDEEVVRLAQADCPEAANYLVGKYINLVRARVRNYFLQGADRDDIMQEGLIGLCKAIRDFEISTDANFSAFADMCIKRQVITAVKSSSRQKHMPLNGYVSLNKPVFAENPDITLMDVVANEETVEGPEELYINRESYQEIKMMLQATLSDLEWQVLSRYLRGKTYHEISAEVNRSVKSIDNALQRIKGKVDKYLILRQNAPIE